MWFRYLMVTVKESYKGGIYDLGGVSSDILKIFNSLSVANI